MATSESSPYMMVSQIAKRALVFAYDALAAIVVALMIMPVFATPAYAYVDPSVMTYTIQALAGVAVALSAVAGVAFRRSRRAIMKAFNIDENAKKDVDKQWFRVEAHDENVALDSMAFAVSDASDADKKKETVQRGQKSRPSWVKRFGFSLVITLFCSFTLCVVAPFEIVAGARGDIAFGLGDVWPPLMVFAAAGAVAAALICSVLPKKVFTPIACFVFSVGLCCYIQAMFLNGGIPAADGRDVDWLGSYGFITVLSAIVWIILMVGITVFGSIKRRMAQFAIGMLSIALILVQGVGMVSLMADSEIMEGPSSVTEAGLFEVSKGNNVVVFILDYYDTRTLQRVIEESPHMLDEMEGFTWYQNSAGTMIPTGFALPYLMTGRTPEIGQSVDDYLVTRWTEGHFLEDLHATGYYVGVYTSTFGIDYLTNAQADEEIYANLDNAFPRNLHIDNENTVKVLMKAALYRDFPWLLKPLFRFYTDEINWRVILNPEDLAPEEKPYVLDDANYFASLKKYGLSFQDDSYAGAFRMIHLDGDHFPFYIDENGEFVGEGNSTKEKQAIGSMAMVSYYLRQMKCLGVYDDATIVITADHGDWETSMELPKVVTSPILLVKNSHAGDSAVQISRAPVSHADFFSHVLSAMGGSVEGYEPATFDAIPEDADRIRDFYYITHEDNAPNIHSLLGYTIKGDVLDFDNWTFTGDVWPCDFKNA